MIVLKLNQSVFELNKRLFQSPINSKTNPTNFVAIPITFIVRLVLSMHPSLAIVSPKVEWLPYV